MEKEIGSNFCEEILKDNKKLEDDKNVLFFDSGRSALRYLLDNIEKKIEKVMLPQYACDSVLQPFVEKEYQIIYYPVNERLELCKEEFEQLLVMNRPQLILVQSYYGFDTLGCERDYLEKLRKQGIIILEDITHSIFAEGWITCADYLFGSLRKWCSIPDGGVLIGLTEATLERFHVQVNTCFVGKRLEAQRKKREYYEQKTGCMVTKKDFISLFDESEAVLDKQKRYYTMSDYTRERILAVDWNEVASKRNKNYCVLRDALKHICGIEILYFDISDKLVPLYFPVYVNGNKRDGLRKHMREKNIFLPVIWPISSLLPELISEGVKKIYDEILVVPCDQRYTEQDMLYIAGEIAEYMK